MGLDMYLKGKEFLWTNWNHPEKDKKVDGFKVTGIELELGYWRKHPNLHGFIVNTFAKGIDECQDIELSAEDIETIIKAVNDRNLPDTKGFFFGKSDGSEDTETIEIFTKALKWLNKSKERVSKLVSYHASW